MPQLQNKLLSTSNRVCGRFAPSPTGALHLGSLVAALGSYLIAKQAGGRWLVRIEDLDPPREVPGSSKLILNTLESFALCWDGEVVYQSERESYYLQRLEELKQERLVYRCSCSRKMVESRNGGIYDGYCRKQKTETQQYSDLEEKTATRLIFPPGFERFEDRLIGSCYFGRNTDRQDFIVKRRDELFAYQLAVVADDIEQGVNQVVRGSDILDSTPRQNYLYHCFKKVQPDYYHLPLLKDSSGFKFSKRFESKGIDIQHTTELLIKALLHLGQSVESEMSFAEPEELISYFVTHWDSSKVYSGPASQEQEKLFHGH
ncbi:MAG: tRNA glutamyl-Q(34) synthetase GluQRS [Kangiellaceae bacterium]|nr:tRNA glutamyl-Q(34) synthetase GluQRS [Kangiellaceae bacterium]